MIPLIVPSTGMENEEYKLSYDTDGQIIGIAHKNCYYEILNRGNNPVGYFARIIQDGLTTSFITLDNLFTFQKTKHFLPIVILLCYSEAYYENYF